MGRRAGSVSAYVENLIEQDERRDKLRKFIDEHFAGVELRQSDVARVREELGLPE